MKKLIFLSIFLIPVNALAWEIKDLPLSGAGFLSSMAAHELGHYIVNPRIKFKQGGLWDIGKWTLEGEKKSTALKLAGVSGQGLYSEGVLLLSKKNDRGTFLNATLITNTVWMTLYPWINWRNGDFDNLSDSTMNFSRIVFPIWGLSILYRGFKYKIWPYGETFRFYPDMNIETMTTMIKFEWRF